MKHTDLVAAIKALGDPLNMNDRDTCDYTDKLEYTLCGDFGFSILDDWNVLEVDEHGEAERETQFIRKEDGLVIGYRFSQHPVYGITGVSRPYFMKPKVVTTYVEDKQVTTYD